MPGTLERLSLKDKLLADYELHRTALLLENPVLSNFRESSIATFRESGFPTRKHEEYKYLGTLEKQLNASLNQPITPLEAEPDLAGFPIANIDAYRLVLVNGFFSEKLSDKNLPVGVIAESLAGAIRNHNAVALSNIGTLATGNDPFLALNSALFTDGIFIHLPEGCVVEKPFHIIHILSGSETPVFTQPRILVVAEKNTRATVVQTFISGSDGATSFSNPVTEVMVKESAQLNWINLQLDDDRVSRVVTQEAHLKKFSLFNVTTITLGGQLIRNNLNIVMDASQAEAHLYGYYHPVKGQIFDNHTLVDHRLPHCNSNELYKGVIDNEATAIFNGKVFVRPDAQKTNAYQSNKNILLSDEATVNTKPQLEIYADDVKCSHGSSTGYIDPTQLFYLRSRGISPARAKALLLNAYAGEVLEKIEINAVREYLQELLNNRLA